MKSYSFIFLIALSLGLIVKILRDKSAYDQKLDNVSTELVISKFQSGKNQSMFLAHLDLEKNHIQMDSLKKIFSENSHTVNDKVIVFRIFQENCRECITKLFGAIKSYKNIVIITNYDNPRELNILVKDLKITCPVFTQKHLFKDESSLYPYMFAIENNKVGNFYIPNEDLPEQTKAFAKYINKS